MTMTTYLNRQAFQYDGGMAETRWLTEPEQRAWRQLAAVIGLLPVALETQLRRDSGLSHFEYWVLAMLSEAPGRRLRMSDLAGRAYGSQSRLSHVVGRLEGRGWVRRERSPKDRRGLHAVLTDEGFRQVKLAAPGHVRLVRELVFRGLGSSEVAELDAVCARILANLPQD